MEGKIEFDVVLPHSPEKVWRALTDSEVLAKWLMPNNFKPRIGYRFQFQPSRKVTQIKPDDSEGEPGGVVGARCEVVEMDAPFRLAYTWREPTDDPDHLPDLVTWTLEPTESGTRLILEHVAPTPTFVSAVSNLQIDSAMTNNIRMVIRLSNILSCGSPALRSRPLMRGKAVRSIGGVLSATPLLITPQSERIAR